MSRRATVPLDSNACSAADAELYRRHKNDCKRLKHGFLRQRARPALRDIHTSQTIPHRTGTPAFFAQAIISL